jgi:asparagine synthase (glutamine-hydrolysing)
MNIGLESVFGFTDEDVADPLFSHLVRWRNTSRTKTFFSGELQASLAGYSALDEIRDSLPPEYDAWDGLSRAQYLEMTVFLSNYLLSSQGDRMAMAHGVEIRLPYLDHRLLSLAGRVPARRKIRGLNEKYLLKHALDGLLPPEVSRRPKHPYRAPITDALLTGPCRDQTLEMLSDAGIRKVGLFDAAKVAKLLDRVDGRESRSEVAGMALAGILSTQMLHHAFVGGGSLLAPPVIEMDMVVNRIGLSERE